MGRKLWAVLPFFWGGELGPILGVPPCQVSFSSIHRFGHNTPTLQTETYRQDRTEQRSDSIGRTVLQTLAPKPSGEMKRRETTTAVVTVNCYKRCLTRGALILYVKPHDSLFQKSNKNRRSPAPIVLNMANCSRHHA